jgi:hypothetical protein
MRLGDRIPRKKQVYGRGQDSSAAKLNDGKVREMRREYAIGDVSYADLGRKYGVHKEYVGRVVRHQCWAHVD